MTSGRDMAVGHTARLALTAMLVWLHAARAAAHVRSHACRLPTVPPSTLRAPSTLACAVDSLAVLSLPHEPDPDLAPDGVVHAVCRGLQHDDKPEPNTGLSRLYRFSTYELRSALTRRENRVDDSEARFVQYADSPALIVLLDCHSFELTQPPKIIAGTQTRGALATQIVLVREERGFRWKSGYERPADQVGTLTEELYLFTLEQQRRPPLAGCWLIKELLSGAQHAFRET